MVIKGFSKITKIGMRSRDNELRKLPFSFQAASGAEGAGRAQVQLRAQTNGCVRGLGVNLVLSALEKFLENNMQGAHVLHEKTSVHSGSV